jgi:Relaxase/Mobilisation nuclease domain
MFSKVFARGAGKAAGTDYLMSEKDAQGKERNIPAEVLRGDPKITKQIISRLNFAQNYKSGVLSFTETVDEIGRDKLGEIMDSFEDMVKAGFEDDPGRIDVLWVLHQDKGRAELHWVIPNVDLETGKRFQPYFDRVDQKMFRAWERLTNTENGFTDPADPARARTINIPAYLPENKEAQYRQINDAITGMFAQGKIKNRDDVVEALTEVGYGINRLSRDYLSIKDPNGLKLRLKGAFYGESFTSPASIERYAEQGRGDQSERIAELRGELEGYVAKRRDYVRGRYCQLGSSSQESDRGEVQSLRTAPIGAVSTIGSLTRPVFEEPEYEVRSLQPESLAVPEIVVAGGVGDNRDVDRSRRVDFGLERDDHQTPDRCTATEEQRTSEESRQPPTENRPAAAENQEEELTNDRIRNNAVTVPGTTEQRSPGERSSFDQAIERLELEVQRIDQASTDLNSRTAGLPIVRSHLQRAGRSAREIGQGIQSATARNQRTSALLGEFAAGSDQTRTTIQTNQQHHANIARQHQEVQRLIELAAERAREKEEQAKQKEELARDLKAAVEEARAKAPVVKVIKTSRSQGHGHSM